MNGCGLLSGLAFKQVLLVKTDVSKGGGVRGGAYRFLVSGRSRGAVQCSAVQVQCSESTVNLQCSTVL